MNKEFTYRPVPGSRIATFDTFSIGLEKHRYFRAITWKQQQMPRWLPVLHIPHAGSRDRMEAFQY